LTLIIITGFTNISYANSPPPPTISIIVTNAPKDLELSVDDLINDFYIYLQENNWQRLRTFRFESKIQTWITVIASRYFLKKYSRQITNRSAGNPSLEGVQVFTDEFHERKLVRAELLEAIRDLKDKRQQHVLLLTLQGFDSSEIGRRMDTTVNNVYVLKSRAIEKLKTMLK
jgi:RNA polymerase sigma factor (sigma-70 family)